MLLFSKYIKLASGEADEKTEKQCQELERQLGDNPADVLYSDKRDEVISYRQRVMEIEADKDDFLYSLAGHKGETMETLKKKTVSDLFSFAERFNEELSGRH